MIDREKVPSIMEGALLCHEKALREERRSAK